MQKYQQEDSSTVSRCGPLPSLSSLITKQSWKQCCDICWLHPESRWVYFVIFVDLNVSVPDSYYEQNCISLHFHKADRSILSIKEASATSHYFRKTVLSTEFRSQVQKTLQIKQHSWVKAFKKSGASPCSVDILSKMCVNNGLQLKS